jgi:Ni/Co efflux regulator RcnB
MRFRLIAGASLLIALAAASSASAQFVDPQRALEESRRARLETDRRMARDAAAQQVTEKRNDAARAKPDAQRNHVSKRPNKS